MTDQQNIKDYVIKKGIKIKVIRVDNNPNMEDWKDANHYKVTFLNGKKQLTTYFSQGYGIKHEPTAEDVLDCLASDAAGYENAYDFEDWARDYGYDTDSRKAERSHKAIGKQAAKLKQFLGDDYETVLYDTERL